MARHLLISAAPWETRAALLDGTTLLEVHIERPSERGIGGNVYRGRVTRVLPGMRAAFVDIGLAKAAFLHMSDIVGPGPRDALADDEAGGAIDTDAGTTRSDTAPPQPPVRKGDEVLVQITKEPIGSKGARISTRISLPGRSLVFTPGSMHVGISRRIEDETERERLRTICEEVRPEAGGLIVRTACEGATKRALQQDVRYLTRLWTRIQETAARTPPPALVHADLDLPLRIVRDSFTTDVERVTVDHPGDHARVLEFVQAFLPRLASRVHLYQGTTPLFEQHGIETKVRRALEPRVWLKSGGYLIFDQTESLTTVDVNTGRYVGKDSHDDTVLRTNLEAARQVAQQLRLRNIGGIIVIDFIDMERAPDRQRVLDTLVEATREDRARTNILEISELGLVQMTRKRTRESLEQLLTTPCPTCDGLGRIKSSRMLAHGALWRLQHETASHPGYAGVTLRVHPDVAAYLLGDGRADLAATETLCGTPVTVAADPAVERDHVTVSLER